MAGHNKWSKVKRKKEVRDPRKAKLFAGHSQAITAAVREAGGDANHSSVRAAADRARADSMPNDRIDRAIERGKGAHRGELEPVVYETYGPEGVAMIVAGLTDNRNRSAGEVRRVLGEHNLNLGTPGAASWAFQKHADGSYTPTTTMQVSETARTTLQQIIQDLEELEDVAAVYTNAAM